MLPPSPPWEVAVPARPTGQTALFAARNPWKFGASLFRGGRWRRRASRGASSAQICNTGGSEFPQIPS
eukprot:6872018-Alexandrium_andersonii.AAC.1